ncbi:MAG: serine hydrolase, partial [Chitinophagaceae bacterium]
MKKQLLAIAFLGIMLHCGAQNKGAQVDSLISAYSRLHKFNGSVLLAWHDSILLNKGYGYRNADSKTPNDANSIYQLGSITKQFTGAVILKLQSAKKLSVTDKLTKYFPSYPKGDSITIEQLLSHTSGIYNYTNERKFMENEVVVPKTREEMIALFKDKPLDFSPGKGWKYSNSAYSLLGYIIEIASGLPYEKAVRQYIFEPANMVNSGFDFTHLSNPNKTTGYFVLNNKETKEAPIVDSSISYAAGSIFSTTGDLFRWHKALQKNIVLSKAEQEIAYTPIKNKYGYGWVIDSSAGKRRVGHSGGIHGFVTNESRVPEDGLCIVLLSNASDRSLDEITKSIYAIMYNKDYVLPRERIAIRLPETALNDYVGEYEITPKLHVVITVKDGRLSAQPTGQTEKTLLAEKADAFFDQDDDIQVVFTRDKDGKVNAFELHQ